jgi:predicted AAA+ superfamily ATPase
MIRYFMENLLKWKDSKYRKPLILQGARQVGKTWVMREFGKLHYKNFAYLSFDNNERAKGIFEQDFDIARIVKAVEIETGEKIDKKETLLIFDEIQECPKALTSLKYFCENDSEYHIVCAGSLLGVASFEGSGFPVGKVDFLTLYPMTFLEFLEALGKSDFVGIIKNLEFKQLAIFHEKILEFLKQYFFIGGMPMAVKIFAEIGDFAEARNTQNLIVQSYYADFAKHIPSRDIAKVRQIWNSIPKQLSKENKRFLYADLKTSARGRDYESALQWLVDSGLIRKINKVNLPSLPLVAYEDNAIFKLYFGDVGLLCAMANLDIKTILEPKDELFFHYKGAIAEQFVLQELKANNPQMPLYYWANAKNTAEIEFIAQFENNVIPIEVKSGVHVQSKSLKKYCEQYKPALAVRVSLKNYGKEGNSMALPIYLAGHNLSLATNKFFLN